MSAPLQVSVVCIGRERQFVRELAVPAGTTVAQALQLSGIAAHAGLGPDELRHVGVFGREVDQATPLRDGDRIEIYRPLRIDPKEARRRRAR